MDRVKLGYDVSHFIILCMRNSMVNDMPEYSAYPVGSVGSIDIANIINIVQEALTE